MATQRFLYCILWTFSALASIFAKPELTNFKNLPDRIFYFEDTTVIISRLAEFLVRLSAHVSNVNFPRSSSTMTLPRVTYTYQRMKAGHGSQLQAFRNTKQLSL